MRTKILFFTIIFSLLLLSCKSQYELMLESNDVDLKYKTAFELFNNRKFSKAASMFESLKLATKGTLQEDTVHYYTALSHFRYGDMFTAESAFESYINIFPRSPFAEDARYLYIICLYDQTLRYELDQTPTYKAMTVITEYMIENPNSSHYQDCHKMLDNLEERLDRKAFEAAKLYYTTEDYKSAHYAFKNVVKDDADNRYREDIMYYTALSSYQYALNSVIEKQKERYLQFSDDYYNFVSEFPESSFRKELDGIFAKVQGILKKDNKQEYGKEESK